MIDENTTKAELLEAAKRTQIAFCFASDELKEQLKMELNL